MPKKLARSNRFQLLGPVPGSDVELHRSTDSPGAVLNKALREAEQSLEPGKWEVWEWDDLLYTVHRLDSDILDVRVEIHHA